MANGFRNSAQSSRAGRRKLFLATLIALVIVLANLASGGMLSAAARDVATPLWNLGGNIRSSVSKSGFFSSRASLVAQVAALQNELQQEQLQAAAFDVVQAENTSLTQLIHLAQTSPGLAAQITSSLVSSPYGTFSIDAGSADGITMGSLVLMQQGFVIGVITQAQEHQSLVQELFAPGVQTQVSIDGAAATAMGQGGEAELEVPHGITISENDPVTAPAFHGRPIGIVQHVDSNPANAQSAVYIALPASLASLQYVYVTP